MLLRRILRQTLGVLAKDAILEWRGRSRFLAVLLFGVVTLLLFSFAVGPDTAMLRAGSGGFLVLALLLSSTLGLQESFRLDRNTGRWKACSSCRSSRWRSSSAS
jgi:heme exporter protein B